MRFVFQLCNSGVLVLFLIAAAAHAEQREAQGWLGLGLTWHKKVMLHVEGVIPDGPAAKAGVRPFDFVVGINGAAIPFKKEAELLDFLAGLKPGHKLRLAIARGTARPQTVTLTVEAMPPEYKQRAEKARKHAKEKAKRSRQ